MAKTVFALIFSVILSFPIPSPVFAAFKPRSKTVPVTLGGFHLTPTIGGYFFAGPEQLDATESYGLKVGYDIIATSMADSLGIEGTLNYFTTRSKTDASTASGYLFRLDAIYPFIQGGKWMPFLAVGAGGIVIENASRSDKNPLLNYGAGLKYFLEDYLAVRVDARHLIVYDNVNTRNNFEVGIGMSYYFGKERKKKSVPPAAKQEEKADAAAGKKNSAIQPGNPATLPAVEEIPLAAGGKAEVEKKPAAKGETPAVPVVPQLGPSLLLAPIALPAKVEAASTAIRPDTGAPAVEKREAPSHNAAAFSPGVKADAGEGDAAKRVGEKPASPLIPVPPVAAEKMPSGATLPSSGNSGGSRPDAPSSLPVSSTRTAPAPAKAEGTDRHAVGKKIVRELAVEFDFNSFYTKPKYYNKIKEIADILKRSADASARIEGHTDVTGKLSYNYFLSKQRAQSLRSCLIKLDVDPGRISTVGYGPTKPIADNATVEGGQKNRRAVTVVLLTVYE